MKTIPLLLIFIHAIALSQEVEFPFEAPVVPVVINYDTILDNTGPVVGYEVFQKHLETILNGADTTGKKLRIRIENIGFFVSRSGVIDTAWIVYHRRPLHWKILEELKTTLWKAAEKEGSPVASHQEPVLILYLTKRALKRHGCWPTLGERLFAPWID